jgi:serine/threonine-protein kinase
VTKDEMADLTGRVIAGRYRLSQRIDRGGTAEVWRARDERLDRDVAVKILGAAADPAFRDRFTMEARRAASVSHPNIVTIFDEGQDGDDAFIVMEEVRGRSLRDLLGERGAVPIDETVRIVGQIGAALDATHRAGLVHLDVKPANVIVDDAGNAKLTDFGIARAARDSEERELVGTARYISPERVLGRPVTPRSDVYGLALIAHELLTGTPAFTGTENEDLLRDRLDRGAPHIRAVDRGLPERTDAVVAKGLAPEPEARYATAGAFADALAGSMNDRAPVTEVVRPATVTTPRRLPRFDSLLALGVVLVLLIGLVLFFARFPAPGGAAGNATGGTAVPGVTGVKLDVALRTLQSAGFNARWDVASGPPGQGPTCSVVSQDPAAGSAAARGSYVSLRFVSGKDCAKQVD